MTVGLLAATILLACALLAAGRWWRDRTIVLAGLAFLCVAAWSIWRNGLDGRLISGPVNGAFTLAILIVCLLYGAEAVGLPWPVAIRLGVGLRNRTRGFDHRIWEVRQPWYAAIGRAKEFPDDREAALADAERHVQRLRALRAPTRLWAEIRDDIADDDKAWIALMRTEASVERFEDHIAAGAPVAERWESLLEQKRADTATIRSPAIRRRSMITFAFVFGAAVLLIGFGVIRSLLLQR